MGYVTTPLGFTSVYNDLGAAIMVMADYWTRALKRALSVTLSFLGLTVRSRLQLVIAGFSFLLALLFFLWLAGMREMVVELQWGLAVIAALAVILVPVFLVNLIAAPPYMEHEFSQNYSEAVARRDDKILYLEHIIEGELEHAEKQKMQAALIDEGFALVGEIVTGGNDRLANVRTAVDEWRRRAKDFLTEHAHSRAADGATFYRAFEQCGATEATYQGASYSGDIGVLAAQVQYAADVLSRMYISEKFYPDYRTASDAADKSTTTDV